MPTGLIHIHSVAVTRPDWISELEEKEFPPMPVLPHEFFGEVTYNGAPLPVGSTLTVKGENVIEGHTGNPLPITSSGVYGFDKLQRLVAQGDLKSGQPLTFWITPSGSNEAIQTQVRDIEAGGDWASSFALL